ncbi:unnamed protein product [Mytilus edulis]|uniref:Uncharacterized protein n=1 Tax=Mytilus edulis TaxID=6550 RepID=A0A8S3RHI9_MYTED|nr:unnamed protein product [Mytilus edulis]
MNKYLDYMMEKFSKEIDHLLDTEKSAAKDFISEVKGKTKTLKEIKEHLHTVTTNSSKLYSVLGVHQIEQQIYQCQQYVDDLENDDRAKEFYITMTQNDEIKNIVDQLGSLKSIEVTVVKTESSLNKVPRVRMKAEEELQKQFDINNMTMNIQASIEVNIGIILKGHGLSDGWKSNNSSGRGKQLWQCTKDLTSPWGLCTDIYGNICVADTNSDSVIVISKNGKNSKVLISKEDGLEDGLEDPKCICFKRNDSFGFMCDGTYLTKYSLSYQ